MAPSEVPWGLAGVAAALVLALLTVAEGNALMVARVRPWEWAEREPDLPAAAEWVRTRLPEFVIAAALVRAVATAVLVAAVVLSLERWGRPDLDFIAAGATVAVTFLMHLTGYLLVLAVQPEPRPAPLRLAQALTLALWPVAAPLAVAARRLVRRRAPPANGVEETAKESEDLEDWVQEVARSGNLGAPARDMVRGVLELGETTAREVMVPRLDMVAVSADTPLDEVVRVTITRGFSRIPVYEGSPDHVIGLIYAKDLLAAQNLGGPVMPLRSLLRAPYFIPEGKKVLDLLQEFRRSRVHLAIVVDEYGGTAGLVTIEDLLEEIVGEIEDEYDLHPQEEQVQKLDEGVTLVDARLSIDDFNELFHLDLDAADYDTVGGFVSTHLGRIPAVGDRIPVNGVVLSVESTLGRRVKRVRVSPTAPAAVQPSPRPDAEGHLS